ncbi:MAG: methyltransferase domain-containing protein [Nitrospirae bacterium]|nr:methyltransferase domain-containing protein [Nitrospirota bacterium]
MFLSSEEIIALHGYVKEHGWEAGLGRFLAVLPQKKMQYVSNIMRERQACWKFLLGFNGTEKALVFDATFGTVSESLSFQCKEVFCVHPNRLMLECMEAKLKAKKIQNVKLAWLSNTEQLPFQDGYFDLVASHDFDNIIPYMEAPSGSNRKYLSRMLKEAARVTGTSGSLFISVQNAMGFRSLFNRVRGGTKAENGETRFSPGFVSSKLKDAGFKHIKLLYAYPSLMNIKEITDPAATAGSRKSLRNIIKDRFVKGGALAPAFMAIASNKPYKSFMENLLEHAVPDKGEMEVERFIADVIVIARPKDKTGDPKGVVIRMPLNEKYYALCRQNMESLRGLKSMQGQLPFEAPLPVKEGVYNGQAYFVESKLGGAVISTPGNAFHKAFPVVVKVLTEFHIKTLQRVHLNEERFVRLFSCYAEELMQTLAFDAGYSELAEGVVMYLRKEAVNKEMLLAWQHGDYKLENLLFDLDSITVTGIIDWDLSAREGLPLLDLLHLLASRRKVLYGEELMDVICDIIIPLKFDHMEKNILERYMNALGISAEALPAMAIIYWLHHVIKRVKLEPFKSNREWLDAHIIKPLEATSSLYLKHLFTHA